MFQHYWNRLHIGCQPLCQLLAKILPCLNARFEWYQMHNVVYLIPNVRMALAKHLSIVAGNAIPCSLLAESQFLDGFQFCVGNKLQITFLRNTLIIFILVLLINTAKVVQKTVWYNVGSQLYFIVSCDQEHPSTYLLLLSSVQYSET